MLQNQTRELSEVTPKTGSEYQAPLLTTIEVQTEGGFVTSTPPWTEGGEW